MTSVSFDLNLYKKNPNVEGKKKKEQSAIIASIPLSTFDRQTPGPMVNRKSLKQLCVYTEKNRGKNSFV